MGKRCCKCCPGSACCGCCCSKRFATMTFSLVGLVLAVAVIVPPIYVYTTDKDFTKLFPAIKVSKNFLKQVTEAKFSQNVLEDDLRGESSYDDEEDEEDDIGKGKSGGGHLKLPQQSPREKYKLAIFQLLDDIESSSPCLALASFSIGCLNLPIHLLLLGGAAFKAPCLMLPWLAVTLLEHLVIGVPMIVFFGIISLYLAAQLQLYLVAGAVIGSVVMLFLISISSWFTVYACYNEFYRKQGYYYEASGGTCSVDATQPLLPAGGRGGQRAANGQQHPPALPPGHPNGYPVGQQQYSQYPPHHNQSRQLPSAPHITTFGGGGGMYPHLPNA